MDERYFSDKIVKWYLENRRELPWRTTGDPYKIWLSEIILQQTRVNQGLPYYMKFIEKFPDVRSLAQASEQEVLRLWQGLGYYTRARNLHKCAQTVVKEFNGVFPSEYEELKKLPGIGSYTAAAIASIAFKKAVAVVDGNVFRVLARIFGIDKDTSKPEGKNYFNQLANKLISARQPDFHNQGVMEFGALYCSPQKPACQGCIFEQTCFANINNLQGDLPVKSRLKPAKKRYFYYFVLLKDNKIALRMRREKDIWQGLYDFHLVEKKRPVNIHDIINDDDLLKKLSLVEATATYYKHVLTHQIILSKFIIMKVKEMPKQPAPFRFYSKKQIHDLPKPVLISRFLDDFKIPNPS